MADAYSILHQAIVELSRIADDELYPLPGLTSD